MTELPAITGTPLGLNNNGQIPGVAYLLAPPDPSHGFLYSNGRVIDLGVLGKLSSGLGESTARAVNDLGQVTGYSTTTIDTHAFRWQNGHMTDLGAIGSTSYAYGINNLGQVVGTTGPYIHAVLWSNGAIRDIGTIGGAAENSAAYSINDAGQVVGQSGIRAFIWDNGVMTALGSLSPGRASQAFKINASVQVVGVADAGTRQHAFLWERGHMTDLGTLSAHYADSQAIDINNAGQVVGESHGDGGQDDRHAFLYINRVMYDLNALIPAGSGWILESANGINDRGQIVGTGHHNGQFHTFLLTPP